ncbi:polynucleotide 5'-hydroxyl-kinase Grc3p [Diutina catenulata]
MSAFAALRESKESTADVLGYEANTSDEEDTPAPRSYRETPALSVEPFGTSMEPHYEEQGIHGSNFDPSPENFKIEGTTAYVGLCPGEHVIVAGQFRLSVLAGTLTINGCHRLGAGTSHQIVATQSQGLPLISVAESHAPAPAEGQMFATPVILKLEDYRTGLENITSYGSRFKRVIYSGKLQDPDYIGSFEANFFNMSYEVRLMPQQIAAVNIDGGHLEALTSITTALMRSPEPQVVCVVGHKNCGKSTFSKALANQWLLRRPQHPISYLDVDPGQSEFAPPSCLSLCTLKQPQFGLVQPIPNLMERESQYLGFSSSLHNSRYYLELIAQLIRHYKRKHQPHGNHLIINTPGWIRGYGKTLLTDTCKMAGVHHLVILGDNEEGDLASSLPHETYHHLPGVRHDQMFPASSLRAFSQLTHFHHQASPTEITYDFTSHLLDNPPYKVSYNVEGGIAGISIFNYDSPANFELEDLVSMVEVSTVAVYSVDKEHWLTHGPPVPSDDTIPTYINSTEWSQTFLPHARMLGLAMVHSIDKAAKVMNCYFDDYVVKQVGAGAIVLVKGESEIVSEEMLNPQILAGHRKHMMLYREQMKEGGGLIKPHLPYINVEGRERVGDVWKNRNMGRRAYK